MQPKNRTEYAYAARRLRRGVKTVARLQEELTAWDDRGEPIMDATNSLMNILSRIAGYFERAARDLEERPLNLPF